MRLKYFLLLSIFWLPFPHCPKYEICNYGLVRNAKSHKIFIGQENHVGYLRVRFNDKNYRVHRLVAITFFGDEGELMHVNHRDFNKHNNAVFNLEWTTPVANWKYNTANEKWGAAKLKSGDVKTVKDMLVNNVPMSDIALILGLSEGAIRKIRDGVTWKEVA